MKKRKKSNKTIFIILITLALVGLVSFLFLPAFIGSLTPEVALCYDSPYDYNCVCPEETVKKGMYPWMCVELPELPDEVTLPINTWEEAALFTNQIFGGFRCEGGFVYDNLLTGEIGKQCDKYGSTMTTLASDWKSILYLGNIVMTECRHIESVNEQGRPLSGSMAYSVRFDPNDGYLYEVWCNDELIDCTGITNFRLGDNKRDAEPTCGDGCCHFGETFENCPADCVQAVGPTCGDGICESSEDAYNKCFTDCYINSIPTDYITNKANLLAYIYGWEGELYGLDGKLAMACFKVVDKPDNVVEVKWFSDMSDLTKVRFRCATTIQRDDGGYTYSSFFDETINWENRIAPPTVIATSFYGSAKFPI